MLSGIILSAALSAAALKLGWDWSDVQEKIDKSITAAVTEGTVSQQAISSDGLQELQRTSEKLSKQLMVLAVVIIVYALTALLLFVSVIRSQRMELAAMTGGFRGREDIFSVMLHEMKVVLKGISEAVKITQNCPEDHRQTKKNIATIASAVNHLDLLVKDITDYKPDSKQRIFCMNQLVTEINHLAAVQVVGKNIKFGIICDCSEGYFLGDELRLRQTVIILISNVVSTIPSEGKITLYILHKGLEENNDQQQGKRRAVISFSVEGYCPKAGGEQNAAGNADKPEAGQNAAGYADKPEAGRDAKLSSDNADAPDLATGRRLVELMGGKLGICRQAESGILYYFELDFIKTTAVKTKDTDRK